MNPSDFVRALRAAAPYVHAHVGSVFVLAFGGEICERADFERLLYDIALLQSLGVKPVVVHGARPHLGTDAPLAAAQFIAMEADYESARLLTLQAAWMADNRKPNSLQASMAKAKAGRTCVDVALKAIELCGSIGYSETSLLEKWARDAKILDIFEGTQQIQQLIVARRLLGKSSAELR